MFSHFRKSRSSVHLTIACKDKQLNYEYPCFAPFPELLLLSTMLYGMVLYDFGLFWSAVLVMLPPSLLSNPCCLRGEEAEKVLTLHKNRSATAKRLGVINTYLATNAKHGTIWAAQKKVYSIPAIPTTDKMTIIDMVSHVCKCIDKCIEAPCMI